MNIRSWFARERWRLDRPTWLLICVTCTAGLVFLTTPWTALGVFTVLSASFIGLTFSRTATLGPAPVPPWLTLFGALPGWLAGGLVLAAYMLLSTTWSADPPVTALTAIIAGGLLIAIHLVMHGAESAPAPWLEHVTRSILVTIIAAMIFLLVEEAFRHPIKQMLYWPFRSARVVGGTLAFDPALTIAINDTSTNWNMPPLAFMLWPALLITAAHFAGRDRLAMQAIILSAAIATIFLSKHWTSMVAVLAGLAVFLAAWAMPRVLMRGLQVVWLAAFLAVLPLAAMGVNKGWHLQETLKPSFRARLILWSVTAERFWQHPVLGVGAASTKRTDTATFRQAEAERPSNFVYARRTGPHAHNFQLQALYELGLVGTLLFAAFGLLLIEAIGLTPPASRPYLMATIATVGTMGLSSFGLFEPWFMASFAITAFAATLGIAYLRRLRP
jgi:O-antigen ligase